MSPTVSIITPAYNAAATLAETLDSVFRQDFDDWELILIDDNSKDDTVAIAQSYDDPRIVITTNPGKGVSSARNHGLDIAQGRYITFLDADDIYYDGALEKRVAALEKKTDWQMVYCVTEMVDEGHNKLGWVLGKQAKVTFDNMFGNPLPINALMGRATIFEGRRFPEDIANGEDWLFHSRILRTGMVWHKVDGTAVSYRQHHRSTVGANMLRHETTLTQVLDIMYAPDSGCPNPDPRYADGLKNPPKEEVYFYRQLGLLVRLMLQDDRANLVRLAQSLQNYDWRNINPFRLEGTVKHAVTRYYLTPVSEWIDNLKGDTERIKEALALIEPYVPAFVETLQLPLNGKPITYYERGWRDWLPDDLRMNPIFRVVTAAPRWVLRKLNI
jgi:glycosyltransferase involved in cell wall biosynthesis